MDRINFDIFVKIFEYLNNANDLFLWSKCCKTIRLFFEEELICKKLIECYYGLDKGTERIGSFYQLLNIACSSPSIFISFQYGFFKLLSGFENLPTQWQNYCIGVATSNHQYKTVEYCVNNGFIPNDNTLLGIAISCKSWSILNLFLEYNFFPDDDLWYETPDHIFKQFYAEMDKISHIRFLANDKIKNRWGLLLKKVRYSSISLQCDENKNLSKEAIQHYINFMPKSSTSSNIEILTRALFDITNRNMMDEWKHLLQLSINFHRSDLQMLFESLFFNLANNDEMIHLLQLNEFKVNHTLMKLFLNKGEKFILSIKNEEIHKLLVKKYIPDKTQSKWNIFLALINKQSKIFDGLIKFWIHHDECLIHLLNGFSPMIPTKNLADMLPELLSIVKSKNIPQLLFKYLGFFDFRPRESEEICFQAWNHFCTYATETKITKTIIEVAYKQCDFAIRMHPSLQYFTNQQFLYGISHKNYKMRIRVWFKIKKYTISDIQHYYYNERAKAFILLYLWENLRNELSKIQNNNPILIKLKQKHYVTYRFFKKQSYVNTHDLLDIISKLKLK